jgi:hypothetical protein
MDPDVSFLELRLKISVVVVVIEGYNIVFAVDRYPVYCKPLHALNADLDQIPVLDAVGQSVNKSFLTNYREAFARNR